MAIRRENGAFLAATAAFPLTLCVGLLKELVDLVSNPWSLTLADLRADSAYDMAWNFAGAGVGILLLWSVLAAGALLGRLRQRPSRSMARLPEIGD